MSLFTGRYANPLNASAHILMQVAMETTKQALLATGTPNVDRLALMVALERRLAGRRLRQWGVVACRAHRQPQRRAPFENRVFVSEVSPRPAALHCLSTERDPQRATAGGARNSIA
ncbi:hypothetical protein ACLMAJ_30245 [Nocardia sp. KC 131]|uniref:hypothetical protein n=1 Tax=Nocardia arseniciresistens TaxID=3392119 RepID=UPI00398ED0F9